MIICADDYGLREDTDRAILELCNRRTLSAVSCMVLFERCDGGALKRLLAHEDAVDIGLHLCLTNEGLPLSLSPPENKPPHFKSLLRRTMLRQVRPVEILAQVAAQYRLFTGKCGRRPDFIDGHLYVHQLPGVRQGLLDFVLGLPPGHRPYIRNTWMPARELRRRKLPWMKAGLIGAFGARMKQTLQTAGVPTNDGFAGIYDFKKWRRYREYLPKFADCLRHANGILVVHPGFNEDWRRQEFESLRDHAPLAERLNRFKHRGSLMP